MTKWRSITLLAALFGLSPLLAQPEEGDPLEQHLFPPELVMRHQNTLQISQEQRETIIQEVQSAQAQFTPLQWELQRHVETLSRLLEAAVDEEEVLPS